MGALMRKQQHWNWGLTRTDQRLAADWLSKNEEVCVVSIRVDYYPVISASKEGSRESSIHLSFEGPVLHASGRDGGTQSEGGIVGGSTPYGAPAYLERDPLLTNFFDQAGLPKGPPCTTGSFQCRWEARVPAHFVFREQGSYIGGQTFAALAAKQAGEDGWMGGWTRWAQR